MDRDFCPLRGISSWQHVQQYSCDNSTEQVSEEGGIQGPPFIELRGCYGNIDLLSTLLLFVVENKHGIWIFISSFKKDGVNERV